MITQNKNITQGELKKYLKYNQDTGVFTWRIRRGSQPKGSVARYIGTHGYPSIRVNGVLYRSHRLAWLYVYGYFPENNIDHINRIPNDNRISNLREVSVQCNMRNTKIDRRNTSGVTGVVWREKRGKWRASIGVDKKTIAIGSYNSIEDAVRARWEAEKKYNFPNCNTLSTAYLYLERNELGAT